MIDVFMRRIIDYAGMFPPAKLSLDAALRSFRDYQHHEHADFLGRFVLPADRLADAPELPSRFSLIVRELEDPVAAVDSVEVVWKDERDFLTQVAAAFPGAGRIFIELDWRRPFAPLMDRIARGSRNFGLKLRTGGLTPESTPPSEAVAEFLLAAAEHKLPLKATAGMHVPTPKYDAAVGARMHGFLNFFCAGFLAYSGRGNREAIVNVLENFEYTDFVFAADSLRCGTVGFSVAEVEQLRGEWVLSFGSCSFLEPIEHLARHGLISLAAYERG